MKNLLIVLLIVPFFSCKKKEDEGPKLNVFYIGGTAYTASHFIVNGSRFWAGVNDGSSTGADFQVFFSKSVANIIEGSYQITTDTNVQNRVQIRARTYDTKYTDYVAKSGTIDVGYDHGKMVITCPKITGEYLSTSTEISGYLKQP